MPQPEEAQATLHTPRFVDSLLPGWKTTMADGNFVVLQPLDSPPLSPESVPAGDKTVERREPRAKRYFFRGPLPKGVVSRKQDPGPGQYNIDRELRGRRSAFGYCPDRKYLVKGATSWLPGAQAGTPGATYVEKRKIRGGVVIGLPLLIPKWGLENDSVLEVQPSMGKNHPCEPAAPKWGMHKIPDVMDLSYKTIAPAPVELSKPRYIGDDKPEYSFGKRPRAVRYTNPDWTANQLSLNVGSGLKFNQPSGPTRHGPIGIIGGTMGGRCGKSELGLPTAANDVPNMYMLAKYESRTLRSQALNASRFPTVPRFNPYYL
eukprot:GEMP01040703.1.p1 GENE.GEMP01040703.1~~GEMP01040703.1.p1  ORF type:complete len:318 (+),score=59.94 GEMP01040703.1:65-1018(+)